ncbi:hypothetical protein F5B21DRAFT_526366 [Xylaria acuta]|nr:hypothetical protein F5B21DRAFT_526366 [Xylaria acuta]
MDSPSGNESGATTANMKNIREIEDLEIHISQEGERDKVYYCNSFMNSQPQPKIIVASDFDYERFRKTLYDDLRIPIDATLYTPQSSGVVNIDNKSSCIIALTQIQGSNSINIDTSSQELILRLNHKPVARPLTPRGSKTKTEGVAPTTPPNPNTQQKASAGPKTADSPGDKSDGELKDIPDDESEDEYDDKTGNYNDIMKHFSFDWPGVDDQTWADVCRFFSCERDATGIRVEGIQVAIEPYQALAIYKALIQSATIHGSFIIGDDVGLGKTGMALCLATILFLLHQVHTEVVNERKNPPKTGAKHLAYRGSLGLACPSRRDGKLQCPCERGSVAEDIVRNTQDFPTLIITLPGLIPTFVGEAEKWIDSSPSSPASPVTVHVAHSSYSGSDNFFGMDKVSLIESERGEDGVEPPVGGGLQHIVIMSRNGVKEFVEKFKRGDFYAINPSYIFLDEFHYYRGDRRRVTEPFQMLEIIGTRRKSISTAVGLSGSARADCAYWRPFIRHTFNVQPDFGSFPELKYTVAGLNNVGDFDKYETSWRNLVNSLNDTTLQGNRLQVRNDRRDELFQFLRNFIPIMMISRQRGDTFRGVTILKKERPLLIRCDTQMGVIRDTFSTLISQVKTLVEQEYNLALVRWISNNRQGEKPIKRAIAQKRLQLASDRPRRKAQLMVPQLILRASTFPATAQLVHDKAVNYEAILGRNVIPIAKRISHILAPKEIDEEAKMEVLDIFKSSTWWEHRDLLHEQSPKIKEVERQIDNLIDISSKEIDDPSLASLGQPPSDFTTIRHLLLYADYPLSAFLMLMVLFPKYCDRNVVFLYAHSGVDVSDRQKYVNYIQQDCKQGDPIKILISTISIIGHGYNIFRANTVIITEIPSSSDKQNQAFGRVDRRGQVMSLNLIQLHDGLNLLEQVRRIRNANQDQLSGVGHDNDSSYPLADLVLDEGDEGEVDDEQVQGSQINGELITLYHDRAADDAAHQAFPNARFKRIITPGTNDMCGAYAVIGSILRQFDQADVPAPEFDDLVNAIYGAQSEFDYGEYRNFSADEVQAGLRRWAEQEDIPRDFRLGYIRPSGQDNEAILLDAPNVIPGRRRVVVWVYLRTTGEAGHFESVERVN